MARPVTSADEARIKGVLESFLARTDLTAIPLPPDLIAPQTPEAEERRQEYLLISLVERVLALATDDLNRYLTEDEVLAISRRVKGFLETH